MSNIITFKKPIVVNKNTSVSYINLDCINGNEAKESIFSKLEVSTIIPITDYEEPYDISTSIYLEYDKEKDIIKLVYNIQDDVDTDSSFMADIEIPKDNIESIIKEMILEGKELYETSEILDYLEQLRLQAYTNFYENNNSFILTDNLLYNCKYGKIYNKDLSLAFNKFSILDNNKLLVYEAISKEDIDLKLKNYINLNAYFEPDLLLEMECTINSYYEINGVKYILLNMVGSPYELMCTKSSNNIKELSFNDLGLNTPVIIDFETAKNNAISATYTKTYEDICKENIKLLINKLNINKELIGEKATYRLITDTFINVNNILL